MPKDVESVRTEALPVLSPEGGLKRYLQQIKTFPVLTADEEFMLAKRWQQQGDTAAAHRLVTSHLRLVAKIAFGYRGYGLPIGELISEGNIGMMQAVKKFDPDKGFRLATYAIWWIKASIQEYVLRSWSLVKMGTGAAQKRLFFNLRKLKNKMGAIQDGDLPLEVVREIADKLQVSPQEVIDMNRRLSGGDASLNRTLGFEENSESWMDRLAEPSANQESTLADSEERLQRHGLLGRALATLNERERHILEQRRLKDEPQTLEDLSQHYNVSRERIRQIETRAFEKLQKEMLALQNPPALPGPVKALASH